MSLELIAHRLNTVVEAQERIEEEQGHLSEAFHAVQLDMVGRITVVEERGKANLFKALIGGIVTFVTAVTGILLAVFGR